VRNCLDHEFACCFGDGLELFVARYTLAQLTFGGFECALEWFKMLGR
jgi:hypothetical protein